MKRLVGKEKTCMNFSQIRKKYKWEEMHQIIGRTFIFVIIFLKSIFLYFSCFSKWIPGTFKIRNKCIWIQNKQTQKCFWWLWCWWVTLPPETTHSCEPHGKRRGLLWRDCARIVGMMDSWPEEEWWMDLSCWVRCPGAYQLARGHCRATGF